MLRKERMMVATETQGLSFAGLRLSFQVTDVKSLGLRV